MARGQLRVYLGSAPGVGKTYRMLDEGWRRRERGTDVVVGYVETHQRKLTEAQLRDLEVVPRATHDYRGARFEEMDVEAVLARRPQVALVDELAHTNAPGSVHAKRWQDVEALLDAGIDVITTVNIQHLESVNDVVEKITGITQQETVPDAVVRRAEQIELVDITPEALRRRMAHGNIYAADKIDASLSNYFRTGNLSALRELALLWLADRVEDALQHYQDDHEIATTWETRERLIIGVTGNPADEVLLRRAARIASRTGAEIVAVHVVKADSFHREPADTSIARGLVEEFEGRFQEIVDDDIATALVAFARSERGTQIVLGASRPRSALRPPSGVVEDVLRHSRDLDVHIIAVGAEAPARAHPRRRRSNLSWRRQLGGLGVAVGALPLLTWLMTSARSSLSPSTVFLVYLVAVLALTAWSGALVGIVAALGASGLENYFFVKPLHTLEVARPDDVVALIAFLLFATGASVIVTGFTRRSNEAERARAEARVLAKAVAHVGTSRRDLLPLLDSLRAVFAASSVAMLELRDGVWTPELVSGDEPDDLGTATRFAVDVDHSLILTGVTLAEQDRQLVSAFTGRIAAGLHSLSIAHDAAQLRVIAEAEALRSGTLRAVANDLREPMTALEREVSVLTGDQAQLTDDQRRTLQRVDSQLERLRRLVANLVDVGRLDTGLVAPHPQAVSVANVIQRALATTDRRGRSIDVDVDSKMPAVITDAEMLERAIAIVVDNACRFSPIDRPVRIAAGLAGDRFEFLIIDQGPGISREDRAKLLDPFERQRNQEKGADLGLTVASGFVQLLGGELRFDDTPGGGLTVIIELQQSLIV